MSDQVNEVYVTRYWESKGVYKMKGIQFPEYPEMVRNADDTRQFVHKPYWYDTEAEAIAHAETLRLKKIKATEKRLEKLKKLKFS